MVHPKDYIRDRKLKEYPREITSIEKNLLGVTVNESPKLRKNFGPLKGWELNPSFLDYAQPWQWVWSALSQTLSSGAW